MNRYGRGKSQVSGIYLPLVSFKKIALRLIIFISLLTPHLGYASVIEVGPTEPTLAEGNAIVRNFTMEFSNKTNATLENYVTTSDKGNAIIQAVNTILMGQDYEPVEPLEEELEEESEEQESSSSSSSESSNNNGDSGLIPQPGDDIVFPDDSEEPQPFPGDGNGSDGEEVEEAEEESSNDNDASGSEE